MTLKAFQKVNTAVKTEFVAWDKNGNVMDTFNVNYLSKDIEKLNASIRKRFTYEARKTKINYVDAMTVNGYMYVSFTVLD